MNRLLSRLFTALVLLLIAGVALAQDQGGLSVAKDFASQLTPPDSDYSVAYLSQIFGTVGNVLHGTSGQVLGKMFGIFNKGILVVAAIWLGYTVLTSFLQMAFEGSVHSPGGRKMGFVMMRVAFGFALLIPSSTTGYSLLQDIFMKVVVQGVGLADQVWSTALDYIEYGGSLYIPPSQLSTDTKIITAALGDKTTQGYITKIFRNEVCMIESNDWEKTDSSNPQYLAQLATQATSQATHSFPGATGSAFQASGAGSFGYHPVYDEKAGVVYFPGVGSPNNENNSYCGSATSYISPTISGAGGQKPTDTLTDVQKDHLKQISFSALKQVVISLLPAAQSYVKDEQNSKVIPHVNTDSDTSRYKTLFSGILAYVNLITPYQTLLQNVSIAGGSYAAASAAAGGTGFSHIYQTTAVQKQVQSQDFIEKAKRQGWIMAGGFYWSVEQSNRLANTMDVSKLTPTVGDPNPTKFIDTQKDVMTASMDKVTGDYFIPITALWSTYVGAQQNTINAQGTVSGSGNALTDSLSGALRDQLTTGMFGIFSLQGATISEYNPISVLMQGGHSLLQTVTNVWIAMIALSVGMAVGAGICESTSPAGEIFRAALTWLKSIMMLITGTILIPGAILAYYVPMYPFLVFTFAAIGWILLVIEGMAAAPLVCAGLAHPEGHDFLGKAEQALMLFFAIFIRPALMIVGLIASMIVSFVAFHMMLSGFGVVVDKLGYGNYSSGGNVFLADINQVVILVIFGMLTMELIEQSFKLVFQLPNHIMTWIGAPTTGEEYGQLAKSIQSGVSAGAKGVGEMAETSRQGAESGGIMTGAGMKLGADAAKKSQGNIDLAGKPPSGGTGTA